MALRARLSVVVLTCFLSTVFSKIVIYRCCPFNVSMTTSHECNEVENQHWAPPVYDNVNRQFATPGSIPDDWTYQVGRPKCSNPEFHPFSDKSPEYVIVIDGNLLIINNFQNTLAPSTYCIDKTGALVCKESKEETGVLIPKCCGVGGAYSHKKQACSSTTVEHVEFKHLRIKHQFPKCSEDLSFIIGGKLNSTHWLMEDGTLRDDSGRILTSDEFCLEKMEESPEEPVHVLTCPPMVEPRNPNDLRFTLYPVGLFLSVFFLAVTIIASCLLPSTYHFLHWRCQTNHVGCLLVGDLLLAVTQLSGDDLHGTPTCSFVAIAMHFIFLAAFFWLNTMCFNIWWTFRDLRPASLDKGQEACRLRVYELYAWGGPLLIAGIGAIFDHLPNAGDNFIRPRFGEARCWFFGDAELLYYFFGPIGVLLLLNLTLFAATARELTCGLWKTEVVKSNTERATLGRVCLKLVVVMGVTWVADIISWVVGGPNYVWYLTDLVNALQGVLIFIVVGCQPQVWAAVKRLWCLSESPNDNHNVRSSSSHALPSLNDQNTSITTTTTSKPVETLC